MFFFSSLSLCVPVRCTAPAWHRVFLQINLLACLFLQLLWCPCSLLTSTPFVDNDIDIDDDDDDDDDDDEAQQSQEDREKLSVIEYFVTQGHLK